MTAHDQDDRFVAKVREATAALAEARRESGRLEAIFEKAKCRERECERRLDDAQTALLRHLA